MTATTTVTFPAKLTIDAQVLVAIAINNLAAAANALCCLPQKSDVQDAVADLEMLRKALANLAYEDGEVADANANGGVDGTAKVKRPGGAGKGVEEWHATVAECKAREVDIFVQGTKRVCGTVELKARLAAKAAEQTTAPPAPTEKQQAITAMVTGFNRAMDRAEGATTPHPLSDVTAPRTEQPAPAPVVTPAKVEPKPAPVPAAKAQCHKCRAKITRPAGSDPFARHYCGQCKPVITTTTQGTPVVVTVPTTTLAAVQPAPVAPVAEPATSAVVKPAAPKVKAASGSKLDPATIPADDVLGVTKKDELIRLCADYGLVSPWGSPPSSGTGAKNLLRQARMKATGK